MVQNVINHFNNYNYDDAAHVFEGKVELFEKQNFT